MGADTPDHVVRLAEKHYVAPQRPLLRPERVEPQQSMPQHKQVSLGCHQAHTIVGARIPRLHHDGRHAMALLNNILGGPGMNARLNIALRERHGLVYTVESTLVSYGDTGTWGIYFGCDHDDVDRCQRLVRRELNRLLQAPLSPQQLRAAKQQLKGQIGVATDNREQFALDFGKSFLYDGRERDIELLFRQIDAVTAEQMHSVACEFFAPERLSTLIIE